MSVKPCTSNSYPKVSRWFSWQTQAVMPALISDMVYFYSSISAAICHATLQCGTHIYMVLGDVTHFLFNPLSVKERDLRQNTVGFLTWIRIFFFWALCHLWGGTQGDSGFLGRDVTWAKLPTCKVYWIEFYTALCREVIKKQCGLVARDLDLGSFPSSAAEWPLASYFTL